MALMVASKKFKDCLYAFVFGYFRYDVKRQKKNIFSIIPFPFIPISIVVFIVLIFLWYISFKRKKKDEIEIKNFITKLNEGILISDEDSPGLLSGRKEELVKLIEIAGDKEVISRGEIFNNIFFILDQKDTDIFTDELMETIANKNVWIFIEGNIKTKQNKKLEKIGKVILFDLDHMETSGTPSLFLGIITRFLSLISRNGWTNTDHVYEGLPYICTISYSFPTDVHASVASILKHQKYLLINHKESSLQITNCEDFVNDLQGPARYVEAETEPFFLSFRGVT